MLHILPEVDSVGLKYRFCGILELKFLPDVNLQELTMYI